MKVSNDADCGNDHDPMPDNTNWTTVFYKNRTDRAVKHFLKEISHGDKRTIGRCLAVIANSTSLWNMLWLSEVTVQGYGMLT